MAPPVKGSPGWEEFLAKQRKKRQTKARDKKIKKYGGMAARMLTAANRRLKTAFRTIEALKGERDAIREDANQFSRASTHTYFKKLGTLRFLVCLDRGIQNLLIPSADSKI